MITYSGFSGTGGESYIAFNFGTYVIYGSDYFTIGEGGVSFSGHMAPDEKPIAGPKTTTGDRPCMHSRYYGNVVYKPSNDIITFDSGVGWRNNNSTAKSPAGKRSYAYMTYGSTGPLATFHSRKETIDLNAKCPRKRIWECGAGYATYSEEYTSNLFPYGAAFCNYSYTYSYLTGTPEVFYGQWIYKAKFTLRKWRHDSYQNYDTTETGISGQFYVVPRYLYADFGVTPEGLEEKIRQVFRRTAWYNPGVASSDFAAWSSAVAVDNSQLNSLENVSTVVGGPKALLPGSIKGTKDPKALAGLYLWYTFSACNNVRDLRYMLTDWSKAIGNAIGNSGPISVKGSSSYTYDGCTYTVVVKGYFHDQLAAKGNAVTRMLGALGINPDLSTLWACVPYSFIVDWTSNFGDFLTAIDTSTRLSFRSMNILGFTKSVTWSIDSPQGLLARSGLSGQLSQRNFRRTVGEQPPDFAFLPTASLPDLQHVIQGGALIINKL